MQTYKGSGDCEGSPLGYSSKMALTSCAQVIAPERIYICRSGIAYEYSWSMTNR
jgi:hypothetical protein